MYVLDTDTLTRLHEGSSRVRQRVEAHDPSEVAVTIITRIEVLQGRFDYLIKAVDGDHLQRAFAWLTRSEQLIEAYAVLPVDAASAAEFDRLRQNKKVQKIGRADLLIAAITLANRATLVTRNQRHFRQVPGLRLENWAD